jgi:hypothetical protein
VLHAALHGHLALCKATGRISISWTHKPIVNNSHEYPFECSIHVTIESDMVNTMICPWVSALIHSTYKLNDKWDSHPIAKMLPCTQRVHWKLDPS